MSRQPGVNRIGIAGWEHEVFDECLYPTPRLASLEKLSYYSEYFEAVEVRQTFWDDSLDASDAEQWGAAVAANKHFRFNIKLHSSFTHSRLFVPATARRTQGMLQELAKADRLGVLVAQFPFSFTNTSAHRYHLIKLGEVFRGFPLHVELRHRSWDQRTLLSFLEEHGLCPSSADLPRLSQFMPFITGVVGTQAYVRLHGRNEKGWLLNGFDSRYDYLYNNREIRELARRVNALAEKAGHVTAIFNNTAGGGAAANAIQLKALLHPGRSTALPEALRGAFPFLEGRSGRVHRDQLAFPHEELRQAV